MPQDAFTLRLVSRELNAALAGGKINKIVQPSKDEAHFVVYCPHANGTRNLRLVLNANASDCGAYFDGEEAEAPLVAPNFCMLLRKHLQGAEILSVSLVGFERILHFRLRGCSDFSASEKDLYLEVMGKYSNLILTERGVILGALKTTSLDESVRRMIFPGVPYRLPAAQEKVDPSDRAALENVLSAANGDLGEFLFSRVAGLAPCTASAIASGYAGGDLAEYVYDYLFSDTVCPCVLEQGGKPLDFYARAVAGARAFPSLSAAQTYFYGKRRAAKKFEGGKRKLTAALQTAVKKHEKRLAQILEKQRECAHCEDLRTKGELLTANLYALQKGMRGCELENWDDGTRVKISLDPSLSPAQNAQNYFKRYRKQKRTLEILAPQEKETREELEYLFGLLAAVNSSETADDLACCEEELTAAGILKEPREKTRKKKEIPFRVYEYGGFRILAGRNNLQNDQLVRTASPDDIWMHTQRYHSCHVIVKTEGRKAPEEVLQFAANVCAKYSDSKEDRAPVDWCLVKHVKKPPKAKAGFVTYSEFSTLAGFPANV